MRQNVGVERPHVLGDEKQGGIGREGDEIVLWKFFVVVVLFFLFVEILWFPEHDLGEWSLHHFSSGPSHNIQNHNSVEKGRGKQRPSSPSRISAKDVERRRSLLKLGVLPQTQSTNFRNQKSAVVFLHLNFTIHAYSCHLNRFRV